MSRSSSLPAASITIGRRPSSSPRCGRRGWAGAVGREVDWAVTFLNEANAQPAGIAFHDTQFGRSPFASVVPGTVFAKPDPRALELAVRTLESRGALYVGDTADDLDLVLRYRHEAQPADPRLPPVLAGGVGEGAAGAACPERSAGVGV